MDWLGEPIMGAIAAISTITVAIITARTNVKLKRIDANAQATADQTVNNHEDTEFPNLRDEQTAMRNKVSSVEATLGEMKQEQIALRGSVHGVTAAVSRLEEWLRDQAKGTAYLEDTITRKELAATRALAAAVEERNIQFAERDKSLLEFQRTLPEVIARTVNATLENREASRNG